MLRPADVDSTDSLTGTSHVTRTLEDSASFGPSAEFAPAAFDTTGHSTPDFLNHLEGGDPLPPARTITRRGRIKPLPLSSTILNSHLPSQRRQQGPQ